MKYIMLKRKHSDSIDQLVPIIFSDNLIHEEVSNSIRHCTILRGSKPVSAGFIDIDGIECHGSSETLKLKSLEFDSTVIQTYDYLHGLI